MGDGGFSGTGLLTAKSLLAGPMSNGSIPLDGIGFLLGDDCLWKLFTKDGVRNVVWLELVLLVILGRSLSVLMGVSRIAFPSVEEEMALIVSELFLVLFSILCSSEMDFSASDKLGC